MCLACVGPFPDHLIAGRFATVPIESVFAEENIRTRFIKFLLCLTLTLDPWSFVIVEEINFTLYSVASGG